MGRVLVRNAFIYPIYVKDVVHTVYWEMRRYGLGTVDDAELHPNQASALVRTEPGLLSGLLSLWYLRRLSKLTCFCDFTVGTFEVS